ncbi:MAG TPA: hypothetical protein VFW78_10425 [Bacteroidia bacterium]|nr:hypothetical protein [Bacteroidia bacterium]
MKRLIYFSFAFLTLSQLVSCYYDNAAEMHPASALNLNCDTTGTITYTTHMVPIFNSYCGAQNSCHSSSLANGGVILSTYATASQVDDATMLGCTQQLPGYNPMPQSGSLSECNIILIRKWIEQGKLE